MQVLSRRHFLHTAAAGLAISIDTQNRASADKAPLSGYIDAHSHIWTADTQSYPLANGQTQADLAPPSFTADELLKVARPRGVDRVVLIQHQVYYGWDNSYMIDAAGKQVED